MHELVRSAVKPTSALGERHVLSLAPAGVDLPRARSSCPVLQKLAPGSDPPAGDRSRTQVNMFVEDHRR